MNKFNLGDIAYFIANGYHIRESKLFQTKQEAEVVVEKTHNILLYQALLDLLATLVV